MQHVEKLTLILVHPLCLHVEHRIRIDDDPLLLFGVSRKLLFLDCLDLVKAF